jgi:SAM-dependent methyltransferase
MPFRLGSARSGMRREEAFALVTAAYRFVLGREPDPEGLVTYAAALGQGKSATWLLETLGASDECRSRDDPVAARLAQSGLRALAANALSSELERGSALPRARYDALCDALFASGRSLIVGQAEYAATHRERFFELMNAALVLTRGCRAPRLLEFGPSEFSAMYGRLIPDVELVVVDRPVPPDYVGFTEARCRASLNCAAYAAVNLASLVDMDAKLGALGTFDLVVMTEVLEHLPVHPVDVLARVIRMLRPEGVLYLTTPNFFAQAHLEQWARGENPCAVFPAGDGNWDAHHHYREYEAIELAGFITAAEGRVEAFCFSGCWDSPDVARPAHRRGNLVFVVARGEAGEVRSALADRERISGQE